jgi:uncharacterized protein
MRSPQGPLPFYFGPYDKPLFGCYHEPRPAGNGNCTIVICQPVGHEYINCHRALRRLAARLCEVGFPVLRFDYYSCGDSSGDAEEGRISQWLEDISTAIFEARHRAGIAPICVVGLRLGAALAMIAGAQRNDIDSMVLWDPVVNGKSYLDGLLSLQKEMLRFRPKPKGGQKSQAYMDVLGFPLSHLLYNELEKLNLLAITEQPAKNVLVIQSEPASRGDSLRDHLSHTQARLEYQRLETPQIWLPTVDGSLLVPGEALKSIVSWTCRAYS